VFNTFEGGAIICPDAKTKQCIDHLKNFGIVDEVTVVASGINGKMSEINAAFGLLQLQHLDYAMKRRKEIDTYYREQLAGVNGIQCLGDSGEVIANYSYFPILVQPKYPMTRDALYEKLKSQNIFARRYFYPLISDFPMYRGLPSAKHGNLPVAADAAEKILCLPIYPALTNDDITRVISVILEGVN
jgi:dTDP-4-amino-4,6-dideoxygalactose transaminase